MTTRERRVEQWKRLVAEGNASRACDLVVEYEKETPPPELLETLASAPLVPESDITERLVAGSVPLKQHYRNPTAAAASRKRRAA